VIADERTAAWLDDVSAAVARILDKPPEGAPPHAIYNLGNSNPSTVLELVAAIERATGVTAKTRLAPPQPGDVTVTFADHGLASARFGFDPKTTLNDGVQRFVDWFAAWRR